MESYSCTTYREQFNAEILNNKEKQEGCLQVTGDGEILRAEIQQISPKGRHTMVVSSNPPMQQKAFQPWGKDNWPTKQESICLVNWRDYNLEKYPGPICRTIHKTAESARKCMAHIPGPYFIGYKPELMADNWHPTQEPPQAETRNKGKGKRTPATKLKPYWRTNYPTYSVWDEETPATSIPSLVKELAKTTKRPRSASQSSSSSSDNYPTMREILNKPPMGPPMSKARKAKAHFYRMKAGEGPSDMVQYHPAPNPSDDPQHSGVVEAEVFPPEETKRFPKRFIGVNPMVTRQELDEGLQHYNETVRSAAFKLHMLISSGRYTKDQALQLEQSFLEAYILNKIQVTPVTLRAGPRQPTLQDIQLALQTDSPMVRKRAITIYKLSKRISDDNDPSYQEAAKAYRSREDFLETVRLLELGVLDMSMTNLDRKKKSQQPEIIGTMTIADDLFNALDSDDSHLKACANDYYSVLIAGTSLRDPRFNLVSRKFKVAMENHNAKLRAQLEELQAAKGQGKSLMKQLHDSEDNQASLSSKIKDLTLVSDQVPEGEADMGQPEVKPQGNLWEQPEATPNQPAYPTVHIPEDHTDEDVPALVGCAMEDFAPEEKFNKDNLDAPIKSESDSSVEEQITEAMAE